MSDKSAVTNPAVLEESLCDVVKRYSLRGGSPTNRIVAYELGLVAGDGSLEHPFCCFFNHFDGTLVAIRVNHDEIVIFNKHEMHRRVQARALEQGMFKEIKESSSS